MSDCLGHHRRVDDHTFHTRRLDYACTFGRFNRRRQQLFNTRLTQALAPARQARRIDRWLRLQERLASKDLPVGILDPLPHDFFVGQVEGMLQIKQACDQAG